MVYEEIYSTKGTAEVVANISINGYWQEALLAVVLIVMVIGTNILEPLLQECSENFREQCLQKADLFTP